MLISDTARVRILESTDRHAGNCWPSVLVAVSVLLAQHWRRAETDRRPEGSHDVAARGAEWQSATLSGHTAMLVEISRWRGTSMKRAFSLFFLGLLLPAAAQTFPADARQSIREHIYDMYPQTASALPLQRTRGDFAMGRDLVFGVDGNPRSYASALVYLRRAAARHYAPAQTLMGFMYAKGYGVPRNDAMARQWYQRAAQQGYARAQINLGNMYAKRHGVSDDVIRAYACYASATSHSQVGTVSYRDADSRMIRLRDKMTPVQLSTVHRIVGGYQARCIAD